MYACNGILFNHESPRRGETFVTRKITRGMARVAHGLESCIYLGNLDAKRDWGHAKDYVRMQWLMLQQERPQDYVIASGEQFTVRDFVRWAAEDVGLTIEFRGSGIEEMAVITGVSDRKDCCRSIGDVIVRVDKKYFRPTEVESLLGDASKARRDLGWVPKISARELCREMVQADLEEFAAVKRSSR